jgi:hypothetical protein
MVRATLRMRSCARALRAHPAHRHLQRPFAGVVQGAQFPQLRRRNARIIESALVLNGSRRFHALAHFSRTSAVILPAKLLVGHGGNFNMQVYAIE